jgi:hypothetical protein
MFNVFHNQNQNDLPFFWPALPLRAEESSQRQPICALVREDQLPSTCINSVNIHVGLTLPQPSVPLNLGESFHRQPIYSTATTNSNPTTHIDTTL